MMNYAVYLWSQTQPQKLCDTMNDNLFAG